MSGLPAGLTPIAPPAPAPQDPNAGGLPAGLRPIQPKQSKQQAAPQTPSQPDEHPNALPAGLKPISHGGQVFDRTKRFSFNDLKNLWVAAGGSPADADIMAHAALSESGDGHTYSEPWSNKDGHTHYEDGGTQYPRGLWQISTVHGRNQDWFDPMTNAREAVALHAARGMEPWLASKNSGAGGGWGQYLNAHAHTADEHATPSGHATPPGNQKLPPGGMAEVLHSSVAGHDPTGAPDPLQGVTPSGKAPSPLPTTFVPAYTPKPTHVQQASFLGGFADTMENAAKIAAKVADIAEYAIPPYKSLTKRFGEATPGYTTARAGIDARLSPTLTRIGNTLDAFTFAPANAILRDLGGDSVNGIKSYGKKLFGADANTLPAPAPGDMSSPLYRGSAAGDLGKRIDDIANEFGFNSPGDIRYWANQANIRTELGTAHPTTPLGNAMLLGLGMHADLARLKPTHPYFAGAETMTAELLNPSSLALGEVGGWTTRGILDELKAARAGSYGTRMADAAKGLANAPVIGNRYTEMGDAYGMAGEQHHVNGARAMGNVSHESQAKFTSDDTFGGANADDQTNIVHAWQNPGSDVEAKMADWAQAHPESMSDPQIRTRMQDMLTEINQNASKKINGTTVGDRATNVGKIVQQTEAELREIDPEMADKLAQGNYFSQQGAWQQKYMEGPKAATPTKGGDAASGVIPTNRTYDRLTTGLAAGREMSDDYLASGAGAMHDAKLQQYITFARLAKGLETLKNAKGVPGLFDIDYKYPMGNGSIFSAGKGVRGYRRMQEFLRTVDDSEHGMDKVRTFFSQQHPDHLFDAEGWLGMPMLRGKAMSKAGMNMLIDVHPRLRGLWKSTLEQYQDYVKNNGGAPLSAHLADAEPESTYETLVNNLNSIVRQGLVTNGFRIGTGGKFGTYSYHGWWNMAPNALSAGVNPIRIARALGFEAGKDIPQSLIDEALAHGAAPKSAGAGFNLPPQLLSKVLTIPYKDLTPAERALQVLVKGSKWNQEMTFAYHEHRVAAAVYEHFKNKGMTPDVAGRETSKLLGDPGNATTAERKLRFNDWHYFYGWVRSQMRYWATKAITDPRKIMAPLRGIQTANQQQGDAGAQAGGALSLRSALNAIHPGWGTDQHGEPRYLSVPGPAVHFGSDAMRLLGAAPATGDPFNEPNQAGISLATSSLTPMAALGVGLLATGLSPAALPQPWDKTLWDKDAPSAATKWMQFAGKMTDEFVPAAARGVTEAIGTHDPSRLLNSVGPNTYSQPNPNDIVHKAQYGAEQDLRGVVYKANMAGAHPLAQEAYALMLRVNSGDPEAILEAKRELPRFRQQLGMSSSSASRYGFKPRF